MVFAEGQEAGYVFATREQGTGYYVDHPPAAAVQHSRAQAPQQVVASVSAAAAPQRAVQRVAIDPGLASMVPAALRRRPAAKPAARRRKPVAKPAAAPAAAPAAPAPAAPAAKKPDAFASFMSEMESLGAV